MFDFDHSLSQLSGVTVLCIGDLMLDDFVYGEVARISPEAPAPVIAVKRSEMVIGGAGNVVEVAMGQEHPRGGQPVLKQHFLEHFGRVLARVDHHTGGGIGRCHHVAVGLPQAAGEGG